MSLLDDPNTQAGALAADFLVGHAEPALDLVVHVLVPFLGIILALGIVIKWCLKSLLSHR